MKIGKYITYLWTWPFDVFVWLVWVLPFRALWGENLRWEEGSLVFNLTEDSWPSRTWYKDWLGTSICHAIMYSHNTPQDQIPPHRIVVHEQHHVKWFEGIVLSALVLALVVLGVLGAAGLWTYALVCGFLIYSLSYPLQFLGNFFVAWLLTGRPYRDSFHEQAAYAVDFKYQRTGKRDT